MYFITKKTSVTGKKFQIIADKMNVVQDAQKALAKEMGFKAWRKGYWCFCGGFSSIIFEKAPDEKLWKKVNGNEWMPRLNSKAGKELEAKLDACPKIKGNEINECIGFKDGFPFKTIGFAMRSKTHFGFVVGENWDVKIPKDCKEVTITKYNSIFKIKTQKEKD